MPRPTTTSSGARRDVACCSSCRPRTTCPTRRPDDARLSTLKTPPVADFWRARRTPRTPAADCHSGAKRPTIAAIDAASDPNAVTGIHLCHARDKRYGRRDKRQGTGQGTRDKGRQGTSDKGQGEERGRALCARTDDGGDGGLVVSQFRKHLTRVFAEQRRTAARDRRGGRHLYRRAERSGGAEARGVGFPDHFAGPGLGGGGKLRGVV